MFDKPHPKVTLHTNYGAITLELFEDKAPQTVANFLQYVDDGFYNDTLIHRVVDDFIIQGGGFHIGMVQKTTRPPIANESGNSLRNERGSVAMARLADDPDSATAQFFINTHDNKALDPGYNNPGDKGYCVFGRVVEGMEVVERIEGVPTTTRGAYENVPLQEIVIELAVRAK